MRGRTTQRGRPWVWGLVAGMLLAMTLGCDEPGEVYPEVNEDLPKPVEQTLSLLKRGFEVNVQDALAGAAELKGLHTAFDDQVGQIEGAEALHLKFGRTSVRVRNPANKSPAWAMRPVAVFGDVKTHTLDKQLHIYDLGQGRRGALEAIGMQIHCIRCHGRGSALGEKVRARIEAEFPDDEALDFKGNELRGWYWVEYDAPR